MPPPGERHSLQNSCIVVFKQGNFRVHWVAWGSQCLLFLKVFSGPVNRPPSLPAPIPLRVPRLYDPAGIDASATSGDLRPGAFSMIKAAIIIILFYNCSFFLVFRPPLLRCVPPPETTLMVQMWSPTRSSAAPLTSFSRADCLLGPFGPLPLHQHHRQGHCACYCESSLF